MSDKQQVVSINFTFNTVNSAKLRPLLLLDQWQLRQKVKPAILLVHSGLHKSIFQYYKYINAQASDE